MGVFPQRAVPRSRPRRAADPAVPLLVLAGAGLSLVLMDRALLGTDALTWAILGGLAGHALSGSV